MAKYTTAEQINVSAIAKHYGLDQPRLSPLAGGAANSSFRVVSASNEFVLTILDNHDMASARKLALHTQALHQLELPTSAVVANTDGALVTEIDGRPVMLKRWIAGEVMQPLPARLLPEAGRILARLHTLPVPATDLGDVPVGTRRLSRDHEALIPQFADREFVYWLTGRLSRVRALEANQERARTIVHGDLFDDNLVVRQDGGLSILDWETISLDDPLLDLGMAAVGLAQEEGALAATRLGALLAGYQEITPLSDADRSALPYEIEHAALIISFHRYYRHNIRYPDPAKRDLHVAMIRFVDSIERSGSLPS